MEDYCNSMTTYLVPMVPLMPPFSQHYEARVNQPLTLKEACWTQMEVANCILDA
jgi:hypothetical protein